MSSIDERIVSMKFDNKQFETNASATMSTLDKLKSSLNFSGATKGLDDLSSASKNFSMDGVAKGVDGISAKFVALATIGITALANITSKAISTGKQLLDSFTIDPIKAGLDEYETNLNAIQTILANTSMKGSTLDDVNVALNDLNNYSDKTIYNFSEMARNIGTFTAAGVDLKTSTEAIKGIANLAAVSGSNSAQASTAMYQLSQALATGTVKLMDWNSVVNAGMGGQVFQDALKETARAHGVAVDQIIKDEGSFRDSLQKGWLTSSILTETLSKFTGDLNAEQLKTMGYTDEQIAGILKMGQTAQDAATKVKTMSQLVSTLQEAAGSGWAQTWQILFGNFDEAKVLFTDVSNVLGNLISTSAKARNKLLGDWKDLGGRTVLIEAIKNAFDAVMDVITQFKTAFHEIFPPATAQQLFHFTEVLRDFTMNLNMGVSAADDVKRAFKGVFALLDVGVQIVKGLFTAFSSVGDAMGGSGSAILYYAGNLGDMLVRFDDFVKKSAGFKQFFIDLGTVLAAPIKGLQKAAQFIAELASEIAGVSTDGFTSAVDRFQARIEPLKKLGDIATQVWSRMGGNLKKVWTFFEPLAKAMGDFFAGIGTSIEKSLQTMDFQGMLDLINTGLFAGLVVIIKKFLGGGIKVDVGGGLLSSIKDSFEGLTGVLTAMQTNIKADTLLKIAGAVGILTVSVVALSMIDSGKLTSALTGMTVMFTELFTSMAIFEKITKSSGFVKMPLVAGSMILLSTAVLILTAAVKNLSDLSWGELTKGLTGVAVLLGEIAVAAQLMSGNSKGLITAGIGMIAIAGAIKILASAVADFSSMNWSDMAKGFAGVGAALTALAIFTRLSELNKAGLAQSAGLLLIAAALKVIASAVSDFAGMSWEELARGLSAMAGSLLLIAGAMALMDGALPGAASLLIVSGSLVVLAQALKMMSGMSWGEIGKSLVELAGALLIIAGAMYLMSGALPGAAALIVVAGALAVLTPVLLALGGMSWEEIGKGLATLAGAFVVIGVAGALLTPVIPTLLGLGAAIVLLGVGTLAAGLGILALSAGITALSVAGAAGAAAIVAIVGAIIGLIPTAMAALANGVIEFAAIIGNSGPVLVTAITTLIISLATAIDNAAPKVVDTLVRLIWLLLNALYVNLPRFVDRGLQMVTAILDGIARNIDDVVAAAINVIASFIDGISRGLPRIIDSGINLIITFVESLAAGIRNNTDRMTAAGRDLAWAIVNGMTGGLLSRVGDVISAAKRLASNIPDAIKNLLGIHSPSKVTTALGEYTGQGMIDGLGNMAGALYKAASATGNQAMLGLKDGLSNPDSLLSNEMNLNPVITPVLDLTSVESDAKKLDSMIQSSPSLSVSTSDNTAQAIATSAAQAAQEAGAGTDANAAAASVVFNQYNNSPASLSNAEIYRQTKNQISQAKGVLTQ